MSAALMTGTQKAALLLIQLGKAQASRVMSMLDESEIEELSSEIARLERVDASTAAEVIDEFYAASIGPRGLVNRGGLGFAQQLLEASMGRERAAGMLERLASSLQGQPFEFLQYADARQVVGLLSGEHPQTIALVMAHLRAEHASQIMTGLGPEVQAEVAHRIALMERASPDVVAVVAENLQRKASAVLTPSESISIRRKLMPSCFFTSGLVRTSGWTTGSGLTWACTRPAWAVLKRVALPSKTLAVFMWRMRALISAGSAS